MRNSSIILLLFLGNYIQIFSQDAFHKLWEGPFFSEELNKKYKENFINCKLVVLGDSDNLFFWHSHRENMDNYQLFNTTTNQFNSQSATIPKDWQIDKRDNFRGYCYLPNSNSILLSSNEWGYQKSKENAISWTLNLESKEWIPNKQTISMSDSSIDFHSGTFNKGSKTPLWNETIYDPINKEALLVGGGGVWGTVSKKEIPITVGDWFFDVSIKQIRRLTKDDKLTQAKKWFPGHAGTWLYSESTKTWSPLSQPIENQITPRILTALTFDKKRNRILAFGGDDLGQCLNDTWSYDCKSKTWSKLETKSAPNGLASSALSYVEEKDIFILVGGYTAGWNAQNNIWVFEPEKLEWTKIKSTAPEKFAYASMDFSKSKNKYYIAGIKNFTRNKSFAIYELDPSKLDMNASAEDLKISNFHCEGWKSWGSPLVGKWPTSTKTRADRIQEIKDLPANTWVKQVVPQDSVSRDWGISVYDINSHKAFSWGGGHSHYPGAEVNVYDLLENRWDVMNDVTNYNPIWLHGMVAGPPGVSFGGWSLLPSHARKSYGVDPVSNSVVLYSGDVFDIKNNQFQRKMADLDYSWNGPSNQVLYITAKDGLYSYACKDNNKTGILQKANVSKGVWETIHIGGPPQHKEHCHGCYDSKRNRLVYFNTTGEIWSFDLNKKVWSQETVSGSQPSKVVANSTYIPSLDAILVVGALTKEHKKEHLIFYHLEDKKWMISDYVGDTPSGLNYNGLLLTPVYDPTYNVIVRITKKSSKLIDVFLMRVNKETIGWKPFTIEKDFE